MSELIYLPLTGEAKPMIPALAFNDAVTPSMGLIASSEALAKGFRTLNGFATAQRQEEFQFKFS